MRAMFTPVRRSAEARVMQRAAARKLAVPATPASGGRSPAGGTVGGNGGFGSGGGVGSGPGSGPGTGGSGGESGQLSVVVIVEESSTVVPAPDPLAVAVFVTAPISHSPAGTVVSREHA